MIVGFDSYSFIKSGNGVSEEQFNFILMCFLGKLLRQKELTADSV